MSESYGRDLPKYVVDYLDERNVKADDLPENVLDAFAGMSIREVQFLAFVGNELRESGLDEATVARIH